MNTKRWPIFLKLNYIFDSHQPSQVKRFAFRDLEVTNRFYLGEVKTYIIWYVIHDICDTWHILVKLIQVSILCGCLKHCPSWSFWPESHSRSAWTQSSPWLSLSAMWRWIGILVFFLCMFPISFQFVCVCFQFHAYLYAYLSNCFLQFHPLFFRSFLCLRASLTGYTCLVWNCPGELKSIIFRGVISSNPVNWSPMLTDLPVSPRVKSFIECTFVLIFRLALFIITCLV